MNINYSFTKISDDSNIYINNSNKREGIVMLLAEKIFQNVKRSITAAADASNRIYRVY